MGLFGDRSKNDLKHCAKMVEGVIEELGLSAADNRLGTENGTPAWALVKGSAEVYIFLNAAEDGNYIQVVSPIMRLPEGNLLTFYRRLLELNADELVGASFGIKGENIVITTDRRTNDLDRSEVREMVLRIGHYADHFDDELVAEFGGRKHTDE